MARSRRLAAASQTLDLADIHPRRLGAGEVIFAEGDRGDGMYQIDSGSVEIWREAEDGKQVVATLQAGAIFGEMALIDGSPRAASASTLEPTVLLFVPEPTFRLKMMGADPFILEVLRLLVRNVRSASEVANAQRIAAADKNPLTHLPGNRSIEAEVERALAEVDTPVSLVYFDFDNFKPFNDGFGFEIGDKAISLFADTLRKLEGRQGCFVGHIGGDDFFAAFREQPESAEAAVRWLLSTFAHGVRAFYDDKTLARGSYEAKDRQGRTSRFPLLRVSAVQLDLHAGRTLHGGALVHTLLTHGKKRSKAADDGFYRRSTEKWG